MLASYDYDDTTPEAIAADLERAFRKLVIPAATYRLVRTSPGHYSAEVSAPITFQRSIDLGRLLKCHQAHIDFVEKTGHYTRRTSQKATGQPTPKEV